MTFYRIKSLTSKNLPKISEASTIVINLIPWNAWFEGASLRPCTPPQKKKYVRGNQSPFMIKTLPKAIIQRSKLRNLFFKKRSEENRNNYVKQRNLCVTLLWKSKTEFFGSLNEIHLCDNKKVWGVVKPLLSNKVVYNERITLVEDDKITIKYRKQ